MKMKSYSTFSKMAEEAINCLNWKQIMSFYTNDNINDITYYKDSIKKKKNKESIKRELKDLIKFVIESNVRFLEHEQWIIFWSNPIEDSSLDKLGYKLEIIFAPTKAVAFENEISGSESDIVLNEEELSIEEKEKESLNVLLEQYVKDENYEVAGIIFKRIKKLEYKLGK